MLLKQTIEDVNAPQTYLDALDKFPQGVENACVFMCAKDYAVIREFKRGSITMVIDLETLLTGHLATYKGMKIFVSRGIQSGDIYWATEPHHAIIWKNSFEKTPKDVSELDFPD